MENKKKENYSILFIFLLCLFIAFIPLMVKGIINFECFNISDYHNLGDAIGGLSNPIIGIGGIILTFCAFYIQYQFNVKQNELIKEQRKESHLNFINSEFTILEEKIFKASTECDTINQVLVDESVNIVLYNKKLNNINYTIVCFLKLISSINPEFLAGETKNGRVLDNNSKYIINKFHLIYILYFYDSLNELKKRLDQYVELGLINSDDSKYKHLIEYIKILEKSISTLISLR